MVPLAVPVTAVDDEVIVLGVAQLNFAGLGKCPSVLQA
jgi:hypothetical protein